MKSEDSRRRAWEVKYGNYKIRAVSEHTSAKMVPKGRTRHRRDETTIDQPDNFTTPT